MLEPHGVKAKRALGPRANPVTLATWATVLLLALGAGANPAPAKDPSAMALL